MDPSQKNRIATVTTPLGSDVLLFYRMTGTEQLGQLFDYEIELLSKKNDIDMSGILGCGMTVKLELDDGKYRYFNGIVAKFSQLESMGDLVVYKAVLRPKLWLLTLSANCRIFQGKTVPDIVKQVLRDHGLSDFIDCLSGSYRSRDYCVQYRESDFNFISRLLEEEGIHYFFQHGNDNHKITFCDSISGHDKVAAIPYFPPSDSYRPTIPYLREWTLTQEIQSGAYELNDYNFEKSRTQLTARSSIPANHAEAKKEVYDYPGEYTETADGDHYAKSRMEQLRSQFENATTRGTARELAVGNLFALTGYPRTDQNREYLVIASSLQIQSNEFASLGLVDGVEPFQCTWKVMPSQYSYRPPLLSRKPVVQGSQTAMVVGKSGEEIWTDKYGRVKVQFHWDRLGKKNETSSCWVRVSQIWAGQQWGAIHIPRIGQEVIVDFLEGDPDQPIVTGRVYNDAQMPPYALPGNQTQSGIKSRSSKGGGASNFNEIRFEDKKDSEQLYIHAEKDMERQVENNDTQKIGFDKKNPGDQTIDIYNHRTVTLDQGNETLTVKTGNRLTDIKKGNETLNVDMGNRTTDIKMGNESLSVGQGNRKTEIKMGNDDLKLGLGNISTKCDLGKMTYEAMQSIELKVGKSSVLVDQTGVTIKGMMIKIEGDLTADFKGKLATTVASDVMLTVKGAITMIN